MQNSIASPQNYTTTVRPPRLYYIDWLRVIATLGVFLFHVSSVFNGTNFEIRNAEGSDVIFTVQAFFYPWGMPLFFFVAGAGSWFAMRRRSAGQFTRERTLRLLVPFITGSLLLGPIQLYISWLQRTETGVFDGTLLEFAAQRLSFMNPKLIGAIGYHLWFLGFLYLYSLMALPLFIWLKGEKGRDFISRLAGLCERRGVILIFIIPLVVVRLCLHPFFPAVQNWADFFSYGMFFVLGYVVFADERFSQAIRRDRWILFAVGTAAFLAGMVIGMSQESFDIERGPRTFSEFLMWACIAACSWCWTAFMLFIGMRFLDSDSKLLRYLQVTILPFFVVHQPVVLVIAYYVVQWEAGITVKFLTVAIGGFAASLAITEFLIKRVPILQTLFGMKAG